MSSLFGDQAFLFWSARTPHAREHRLIAVGDCAPDATLTDTNGRDAALSSFWTRRPTVLVFLRHFGCIFCREQVALLRRDYQKFLAADAEIVCVALGAYKMGKAFQIFLDLPFPLVVSGDDTAIFRAYGLGRGTFSQLFGVSAILGGIKNLFSGHTQGLIASDGFQMPGTFIVDTQGVIRYAHRARDVTDHAPHADLLAVLRDLQVSRSSSDQSSPSERNLS